MIISSHMRIGNGHYYRIHEKGGWGGNRVPLSVVGALRKGECLRMVSAPEWAWRNVDYAISEKGKEILNGLTAKKVNRKRTAQSGAEDSVQTRPSVPAGQGGVVSD